LGGHLQSEAIAWLGAFSASEGGNQPMRRLP